VEVGNFADEGAPTSLADNSGGGYTRAPDPYGDVGGYTARPNTSNNRYLVDPVDQVQGDGPAQNDGLQYGRLRETLDGRLITDEAAVQLGTIRVTADLRPDVPLSQVISLSVVHGQMSLAGKLGHGQSAPSPIQLRTADLEGGTDGIPNRYLHLPSDSLPTSTLPPIDFGGVGAADDLGAPSLEASQPVQDMVPAAFASVGAQSPTEAQWRGSINDWADYAGFAHPEPQSSDTAYHQYYEIVSDAARSPGMTNADYAVHLADVKQHAQDFVDRIHDYNVSQGPIRLRAAMHHDTNQALVAAGSLAASGAGGGAASGLLATAELGQLGLFGHVIAGSSEAGAGDLASQSVRVGSHVVSGGEVGQARYDQEELRSALKLGAAVPVIGEGASLLLGKLRSAFGPAPGISAARPGAPIDDFVPKDEALEALNRQLD
jgi:hypothetical protein